MQPPDEHPSQAPHYDHSLKRLLTQAHDGFLATFAPPGLVWRGARSPELPAVARQADLVWEVEQRNGAHGLLHIELQLRPDAEMGERVVEYAIRLNRRDRLPVRSLVVYLRPTTKATRSPFAWQWNGQDCLRYDYDVIRLWELAPEQVLDTPYYELWPLATLMGRHASVAATLAVAERLTTAPVERAERDELIRSTVLLAGIRLPIQIIQEAMRRRTMLEDLWKESSLGAALEGLAEERGEARGEAQGRRDSIRIFAEVRFGPLSEQLMAAINNADPTSLDDLLRHVALDTQEQFAARLGVN